MAHFRVDIRGDAHREMGLLAVAGIETRAWEEPTDRLTARLSAENAESARGRVLAALMGKDYTVEGIRLES